MKKIFSIFLYILGLSSPAVAQPMSAMAFTQEYAKILSSEAPTLKVKIKGEMQLLLRDASGKETTAFLDNAYAAYVLNPKNRQEVITTYVHALLSSSVDTPIDSTQIVPLVKDRPWLTEMQKSVKNRTGEQISENVYEILNNELVIIYAVDTPKNIKYLSPDDLLRLGIKKEELRGIAVSNLRKLLPDIKVHAGPHVSMITAGGDYEASLLLLEDTWIEKVKVDGDIVVALPSRDLLFVTGSRDLIGLDKLREIANKAIKKVPYPLTEKLFVFRDGKFQLFEK
jgi:uncharacterized protein YtpQ (UPF0354 family)